MIWSTIINCEMDLTVDEINLTKSVPTDNIDDGSGSILKVASYEDIRRLVRKKQCRFGPFEKKLFRCWKKSKPNSKERDLILKVASNFENRRWRPFESDEYKLNRVERTGQL